MLASVSDCQPLHTRVNFQISPHDFMHFIVILHKKNNDIKQVTEDFQNVRCK